MSEITYVMKCGCEIPKAKTYRSRVDHTTKVLCRKHKKPVLHRKKKCKDCGEWFILKDMGPGGIRCEKCAKAMVTLRRAGYIFHQKPKIKNPNWSVDKRGDYCRLLPKCEFRQCAGCREFVGVFPGVDPEKWLVPGVRL